MLLRLFIDICPKDLTRDVLGFFNSLLDIHREKFVVAAQYDHATPRRPSRRFAPAEFWPRRSATLTAGLAPFAGLRPSDKLQGRIFNISRGQDPLPEKMRLSCKGG